MAGAAAGMSAVFGTPVAATLFGVELLIFEFRPRSTVLIGLAAATADGIRMVMANAGLVTPQPIFPVPMHAPLGSVVLLGAAAVALLCGLGAWVMNQAVYGAEDLFKRLGTRVHWMWWPALGGVLIGVGGLVDHRALGVGYDTIHAEKVARRGFHVMREYAVDPLDATFVREVMDTEVFALDPDRLVAEVYRSMPEGSMERRQRLYPVLDGEGGLRGVVPWSAVLADKDDPGSTIGEAMTAPVALAYPDEILRAVADRMAGRGVGAIPVVDRARSDRLLGLVTGFDVLAACQKLLEEERHAERVLRLRRVNGAR